MFASAGGRQPVCQLLNVGHPSCPLLVWLVLPVCSCWVRRHVPERYTCHIGSRSSLSTNTMLSLVRMTMPTRATDVHARILLHLRLPAVHTHTERQVCQSCCLQPLHEFSLQTSRSCKLGNPASSAVLRVPRDAGTSPLPTAAPLLLLLWSITAAGSGTTSPLRLLNSSRSSAPTALSRIAVSTRFWHSSLWFADRGCSSVLARHPGHPGV